MKPRIFIGSSTEGLPVAQRIKDYFEPDFDCFIWNDKIFQFNDGFLETLLKSASLFDFGFMVFAADDISRIRHKEYNTTRDNVLFEYGLFLGRIGTDRAYIIMEEGIKLPTDLLGITYLSYKTENKDGVKLPDVEFESHLEELKKSVNEKFSLAHFGLLPSTVIAISYFENFVKPLVDELTRLDDDGVFNIENNEYNSIKFKIIVPMSLDVDMTRQAKSYFKKNKYKRYSLEHPYRSFPIHVDQTSNDEMQYTIADIPTILGVLNKALDSYFRVGHIGKTQEQILAEEKEICNFKRVLSILIDRDTDCREIVEIVDAENNLT